MHPVLLNITILYQSDYISPNVNVFVVFRTFIMLIAIVHHYLNQLCFKYYFHPYPGVKRLMKSWSVNIQVKFRCIFTFNTNVVLEIIPLLLLESIYFVFVTLTPITLLHDRNVKIIIILNCCIFSFWIFHVCKSFFVLTR